MDDIKKTGGQEKNAALDSVESVEIAGITEPEKEAAPEPTASAGGGGDTDNLSEEIELRMRAIDALMIAVRRVVKLIDEAESVPGGVGYEASKAADAVNRIIRPLSVQIENMLPELRDFADNLEALGEGEKSDRIQSVLGEIEDEHLPKILAYLEKHPVAHDPARRPVDE